MKKITLLLFLFALSFFSYAQSEKELKVINKAMNEISEKIDEFNGSTDWNSPYYGDGIYSQIQKSVRFIKSKTNDNTYNYYLILNTYGATLNVSKKGFILLFEDGTKFEKPDEKVDVEYIQNGWFYSTFTRITEEELELFATKKVKKFKLYIYEGLPLGKNSDLKIMGHARAIKAKT